MAASCVPLAPLPSCASTTQPCLAVSNRVTEAIQLTQVTPGTGPKCATVQAGQDAAYAVDVGDVYQVVGVQTQTVYFSNYTIYGTANTMEVIPPAPPGPVNPTVSCQTWQWKPILASAAIASAALLGTMYIGLPSLPPLSTLEGLSSDAYLALTTRRRKASAAFTTTLVVVALLLGVLALLWCWAEGPCSKRATCAECRARGSEWASYQASAGDSLLNQWACKYLGRCRCDSALLEQKCRQYAAQSPSQSGFQWDTDAATQRYKANDASYLCACCNGTQCVNCQQPQCQSCQRTAS